MAVHKKGGGVKGKAGSKGQDTEGDTHPIYVMRKAISLGTSILIHKSLEVTEITPHISYKLLQMYDNMRIPADKETMIERIWQSKQSFADVLAGKPLESRKTKISLGGSPLVGGIGRRNF